VRVMLGGTPIQGPRAHNIRRGMPITRSQCPEDIMGRVVVMKHSHDIIFASPGDVD
jgi:hypothetical protein